MNVCDRQRQVKVREEVYQLPCGGRYCPACGQRWMGDQRVQAVAACEQMPGDLALLTITGPGRRAAARMAAQRGMKLAEWWRWWNDSAAARYRGLHLEASGAPRRACVAAGDEWRVEFRVWEYQKRGAKHAHVVAPMGTPAQVRATTEYAARLAAAAEWWGFGFILGGDSSETPRAHRAPRVPAVPAGAAARYVAKYVAATGAGKDSMVATVQRIAQRGSVLYVNVQRTRASGCNMTTLRNRRRVATKYAGSGESRRSWAAACMVDAIARGRAPLTRETTARLRAACGAPGVVGWVDVADGELRRETPAPVPLTAREDRVPWAGPARVVVVALASVLRGDPQRPELGPARTELEASAVVPL